MALICKYGKDKFNSLSVNSKTKFQIYNDTVTITKLILNNF